MRTEAWDVKLLAWADARVAEAFVWGQTDCVILALEAHDLIAGSALADVHRGGWDSEYTAKRYMINHDIDIERGLVAAGCELVAPGYLQRGDFILVQDEAWICAHVCIGHLALSSRPGDGVILLPDALALALRPGARTLRAG